MDKHGYKGFRGHPVLIKRIKCSCGWYNNQPSQSGKKYMKCVKCGLHVDPKERFKYLLGKELDKDEGLHS